MWEKKKKHPGKRPQTVWGAKGYEAIGDDGDDDDDDEDTHMRAQRGRHMRAQRSRHMRAHESRHIRKHTGSTHMRANICEDTYESK